MSGASPYRAGIGWPGGCERCGRAIRFGSATAYRRIAPAYDQLIGRPFFDGLRAAFEEIVRRHRIEFRSAADVGCGTGLFARYLARQWRVPVFAVDRSGPMLQVARQHPCAGVRYLQQDVRELDLPRTVELITANFDTLNHLLHEQDVRRAFSRIHACLTPRGHFIFDVITPALCMLVGKPRAHVLADGTRVRQDVVRCGTDGRVVIALTRVRGGSRKTVHNTERVYPVAPLTAWLRHAGFAVLGMHDASGRADSGRDPERVMFVARRL